jgi:ABC-type transport system substrate-binding protein
MYVMDLLFNSASSINFSGWNTPQTDKILNAALTEQDPAKRNALARQFQEIFYRDIPEVIVAVRPTVTAMRDTVTGYTGQLNQMVYWPRLKPAG